MKLGSIMLIKVTVGTYTKLYLCKGITGWARKDATNEGFHKSLVS